jgi:sRNA-binding carbon storage regulator CsrA
LSRKAGEQIVIKGGGIEGEIIVEVVEIRGRVVSIGVVAAKEIAVDRLEIAEAKKNFPRMLD